MRLNAFRFAFEPASFDPKVVRRRELVRTWLTVLALLVALVTVCAFVLSAGLGGDRLFER